MSRRSISLLLISALTATVASVSVGALTPVAAATSPLVADAGSSSVVSAGDHVIVLGSGFGGVEPYTFQWSSDAGTVRTATNAATGIDTTDVGEGQYTATLTVTDSAGATATDTVDFLVAGSAESTEKVLHEETIADPVPSAQVESFDVPFEVPAGLAKVTVDLSWDNPTVNDYDLVVLDPAGTEVASSGNFGSTEAATVADPPAGTWTARIDKYASSGNENLYVLVTGATPPVTATPLPTADAGFTYEFTLGQAQQVTGSVEGGQAPITSGWDTDLDGQIDVAGTDVTLDLPRGHHLVRFMATDARGLESQEMTSVIVGTQAEIDELAVPITVIGMSDSGINPYHEEFSAATYPDPEILRLTNNFTRHPSEYIPGYPETAIAAPITHGTYYPTQDEWIFKAEVLSSPPDCEAELLLPSELDYAHVEPGLMYWFPGTKIIGGISPGTGYAGCGADIDPILDNNGHGTGSASVSTGNRYGYCPTCLIMMVEGLTEEVVFDKFTMASITSHSHGYVGGLPIGYEEKALYETGLSDTGPGADSKKAAERGQNVLFAAGNGIGNAFDVPQRTYDSDQTGPAWNLVVGALRRDDQGAITGDGVPQHISSWGDGNLPSACRTGVYGQCAFGGTSAATPYTAGAMGTTLQAIKEALGDSHIGLRPGQVVAQGTPIPASPYLNDGTLTRRELRGVFLKTAEYLNVTAEPGTYPFPDSYNNEQGRFAHEGYGMGGPNHATRAIAVLLGEREIPDRSEADEFFAQDCQFREGLYGQFDRDGDGEPDSCDKDIATDALFKGTGERTTEPHNPDLFDPSRGAVQSDPVLEDNLVYYLHREPRNESWKEDVTCGTPQTATENDMEQFMDQVNSDGDLEPCFDSRITSTVAAFRPKGIFTATDTLGGTLPAGSSVGITVYVQVAEAGPLQMTGRLMATDRVLGESPEVAAVANFGSWTEVQIDFTTDRAAFRGEHLTIQFTLAGQAEWAYGHEGDHASFAVIEPAPAPDAGDEFGVTVDTQQGQADGSLALSGKVAFPDMGPDEDLHNAGFHPVQYNVEISLDDDTFSNPVYAAVDPDTGTWSAVVADAEGSQVFVRAMRDRTPSFVVTAGAPVSDAAPEEEPLPTTGGGAALAALAMVGAAGALRRRRRAA